MKNITFYKIGMKLYKGAEDKNSGLYEYNLIKSELELIDAEVKFGTLIILNGKSEPEDLILVESMIEACHKVKAKAIYIVTDSIAFDNIDFVNKFDIVLHQAYGYKFDNIKVKQQYSYVPELFYTGKNEDMKRQYNNLVLFCGNDTERGDKIDEYVRGKNGTKKYMFSLIKYKDGEDERIPHDIYLRLQNMFKYSLMICRKQYRDCGWITARLIEAIDAGSLPLFDKDYDINFLYRKLVLTVNNKKDLNVMVKYFNENEDSRIDFIIQLQNEVKRKRNYFVRTIKDFCKAKE